MALAPQRAPSRLRSRGVCRIPQRLIVTLLHRQQQLWKLLATQHVDAQRNHHNRRQHRDDVEDAAQPLPSLAPRIVENLASSFRRMSVLYRSMPGAFSQLSENPAAACMIHNRCLNCCATPPEMLSPHLLAGLLLRLWFIHYYPVIDGDTLVYGEIARNWFWHGIYGFTRTGRHPPYPDPASRLSAVSRHLLFSVRSGPLHFRFIPAGCHRPVQLPAGRRLCRPHGFAESRRGDTLSRGFLPVHGQLRRLSAHRNTNALLHRARPLCPRPLSGAVPISRIVSGWFWALVFSISYAALLRPTERCWASCLCLRCSGMGESTIPARQSAKLACACTLLALIPFVPWTIRNERTLHVFQPLAPRYANNPGEFVPRGWIRWVQSWAADYTSTAEIYWNVNGSAIDLESLPSRAFDTPRQKAETARLFDLYNADRCHDARGEQRLRSAGTTTHPSRIRFAFTWSCR